MLSISNSSRVRPLPVRVFISLIRQLTLLTDVYNSSAAYSVLPIENTIHGAVLESLDCLLNPSSSSPRAQIIAETALSISHSLVGLRGTRLEEIQYVRSHEQALGQCSHWLDTHCPRAKRGASDSTAGAAMDLLGDEDGTGGIGAAICSKDVVEQYPQLEVLAEGIQDRKRECPSCTGADYKSTLLASGC